MLLQQILFSIQETSIIAKKGVSVPKLVFAYENDSYGPMCLNDDNTLGSTNFIYSQPYTINGLDYIDELFTTRDGNIFARVLFINDLEEPQELSSRRQYYKLEEVISYPSIPIPGLVITSLHENSVFKPWILQNWIIAKDNQHYLNMQQWHAIQSFMQHQYLNEQAALNAYHAAINVAYNTKLELQAVKGQVEKLKTENAIIKATIKIEEFSKKIAKATAPKKSSKAQYQKERRDDILLRAAQVSARAILVTQTLPIIFSILRDLHLQENERNLLIDNLNIPIEICGYLLNKMHKKNDIDATVKVAFLYKLNSYTTDELLEYGKNNPTQNFVTIAFEFSKDNVLLENIKLWNHKIQISKQTIQAHEKEIQSVKQIKIAMHESLKDYFIIKPELLLKKAILEFDSAKYYEIIEQHPKLNKKLIAFLKNILPLLDSSASNELKKFLCELNLSQDIWLHFYTHSEINYVLKEIALEWVKDQAQTIFANIIRKTKPVTIPEPLLPFLNTMTNDMGQTLLMMAFAKQYPDDKLEYIFIHAPGNLTLIDYDDQTLLHYIAKYYKGDNYDLIQRIRDAFIITLEKTRQSLPDYIRMQSEKAGGNFLHSLLYQDNSDHALRMIRLFFDDSKMPTVLTTLFRISILEKNHRGDTISIILDSKNTEWRSVRITLYDWLPATIFDYKFPHNYGYFFISNTSCNQMVKLATENPGRLIDLLNLRTKLQLECINKIDANLQKTPETSRQIEQQRFHLIMKHFNFEFPEAIMIPGTATNIHLRLAKKICTEQNKDLEKKYNASLFYKTYTTIAISDSLLWNKFLYTFSVWEVFANKPDKAALPYKNLSNASLEFVAHIVTNPEKLADVIECFFKQNVSPALFGLFINLCTRNPYITPSLYSELFRYKQHRKFTCLFNYLATNISNRELVILANHVMDHVLQGPCDFGLLLRFLDQNSTMIVTEALFAGIDKYFGSYEKFLTKALDEDYNLLICNLLSQRTPQIGKLTMQALCVISNIRNDFKPLYKLIDIIKLNKSGNWDPEIDFIQQIRSSAAKCNLDLKESVQLFKPTNILRRPKLGE